MTIKYRYFKQTSPDISEVVVFNAKGSVWNSKKYGMTQQYINAQCSIYGSLFFSYLKVSIKSPFCFRKLILATDRQDREKGGLRKTRVVRTSQNFFLLSCIRSFFCKFVGDSSATQHFTLEHVFAFVFGHAVD